MNVRSFALLAAGLVLSAACGGGQPEPTVPTAPAASAAPAESAGPASSASPAASAAPAPSAAPAASAAPAQKSWTDMSHEERLALMKTEVLPKMKDAFQAFDPKDFADFSCKTCHGEGIKDKKFDMPNPKLPILDATGGFKKDQEKHPKALKFMMTTVAPQMADILGLPHYDPATHQGFGCANCHTFKKGS